MEWLKQKLDQSNLDFVGKRKPAAYLSALLVLLSWVAFFAIGPNWGIDFTGGTEIHIQFEEDVEITQLRQGLAKMGLSDDAIQQVGAASEREFAIRIQDATYGSEAFKKEVSDLLIQAYGPSWITAMHFDAEVGARLSIEYSGESVKAEAVRQVLSSIDGVSVKDGLDDNQVIIKTPGLSRQIEGQLRTVLGDKDFSVVSTDAVGPKVGGELRTQSAISVLATLGLVLLYIAFRFDLAFAPGAVLALFHDVSITLGVFVLLQREMNLPIIGALLTIVGYSLNDTIIVYDRIRENMGRYRRGDLFPLINHSLNETLSRTVATSATTMMAIIAFLFLGGPVIENFALAMIIGIVVGTYSSIYVASPMIVVMEEVKPWLSKLVLGLSPEVKETDASKPAIPVSHPVSGAVEEAVVAPVAEVPAVDEEEQLSESEKRRRERARRLKELQ